MSHHHRRAFKIVIDSGSCVRNGLNDCRRLGRFRVLDLRSEIISQGVQIVIAIIEFQCLGRIKPQGDPIRSSVEVAARGDKSGICAVVERAKSLRSDSLASCESDLPVFVKGSKVSLG